MNEVKGHTIWAKPKVIPYAPYKSFGWTSHYDPWKIRLYPKTKPKIVFFFSTAIENFKSLFNLFILILLSTQGQKKHLSIVYLKYDIIFYSLNTLI